MTSRIRSFPACLTVPAMASFPQTLCLRQGRRFHSHPACAEMNGGDPPRLVPVPEYPVPMCPCPHRVPTADVGMDVTVAADAVRLFPRSWLFVTLGLPLEEVYHTRPCGQVVSTRHYVHEPCKQDRAQATWCQDCVPDASRLTYTCAVADWQGYLPWGKGDVHRAKAGTWAETYTTPLALLAARQAHGSPCPRHSTWFRVQPVGYVHKAMNGLVNSHCFRVLQVLGEEEARCLTTGCVEHMVRSQGTRRMSFLDGVENDSCTAGGTTGTSLFGVRATAVVCAVCVCLLAAFAWSGPAVRRLMATAVMS